MTRLRRSLPLWVLLASSCGNLGPQSGTDVGNGASVALNLQGYEDPSTAKPQSLMLGDGERVDLLYMVVDRVRLQPGASCQSGDSGVDVEGPLVADVLGGGFLSGPVTFAVTPGPFCLFRLGFQKLDVQKAPPGTPAELADLSILIKGARADGVPFTVQADFGDEIEIDAKNGSFQIPKGKSPLVVAFELGSWMKALSLGTLSGNPVVVSKDVNKDRLDALHDVIKGSERVFKDSNGDGKLDQSEETPDNQLTQ